MAQGILSNKSSKLNLSRRQIALLEELILLGNRMAQAIGPDYPYPFPKGWAKMRQKWFSLKIELADEL